MLSFSAILTLVFLSLNNIFRDKFIANNVLVKGNPGVKVSGEKYRTQFVSTEDTKFRGRNSIDRSKRGGLSENTEDGKSYRKSFINQQGEHVLKKQVNILSMIPAKNGGPLLVRPSDDTTTLICNQSIPMSSLKSSFLSISIYNISNRGFKPTCPAVFDMHGQVRQASHMCTSSIISYICSFRMNHVIITRKGALIRAMDKHAVSFEDISILGGGAEPQYFPDSKSSFLSGINIALSKYKHYSRFKVVGNNTVVPIRMRWDDCFNHLSFQIVPLIALVYEFHSSQWDSLYWHASRWSGALLLLLDVSEDRIILERNTIVSDVLLPWVPMWNPLQLSSIFGIANKMMKTMTSALLSKSISDEMKSNVSSFNILLFSYNTVEGGQGGILFRNLSDFREVDSFIKSIPLSQRFVVYLGRNQVDLKESATKRLVVNEQELLHSLVMSLRPDYPLVYLGSSNGYTTAEKLHVLWQRYAMFVSRARVIVGPHGGGFNNILWAPDDCDIVEFNEFPDDNHYTQSHGQTHVRSVFLTAFWAKGSTGKYWNIEASLKHPKDFYEGPMRVSPRELLMIIAQIGQNETNPKISLLLSNASVYLAYPNEVHSTWSNTSDQLSKMNK